MGGVIMAKSMSTIGFKLMSLMFKIRDIFRPRLDVLKEVGIEVGYNILDFGCGPGGYIVPLAKLISPSGKIYALDINPLAIEEVKKIAKQKSLENIETIQSDCITGLADNSVDAVLLYDTFHHLSQPDDVLRELHRILKSSGILSFSDHHMKEKDIIVGITSTGLFKLAKKGEKTFSFSKID
jgi:ubiquinone/menaquinone biosynthesis C-methylase UbiE